ncbi:MAG: SpoIID/LytB domain-containing protein [Candidatus Dadabacteria bacterium]|nr:MAG: SpoIID/LytB domain-containing protein [Candidatus Dadabacteria bacterium]
MPGRSRMMRVIALVALVLSAGCARTAPPAPQAARFDQILAEARTREQREGLEAAVPLYLEALMVVADPGREALLRYQLAMHWLEQGNEMLALDVIAPLLERDPNHPLAAPLRERLMPPNQASAASVPSSSPTAATSATRRVQASRRSALRSRLAALEQVRVRLPDEALEWRVTLEEAARIDGERILPSGWQGTLRQLNVCARKSAIEGPAGALLRLKVQDWRGHGRFVCADDAIVMTLPLDDYLVGVVGTEMAWSWPTEALKAQAVASRTYLVYQLLRQRGDAHDGWDLRGDVYDQAFRPRSHPKTIAAVADTHGELILWRGAPARVFFHADNGGISEDPRFVWQVRLPYYEIRQDPFSNRVPAWTATVSLATVARRLHLPPARKLRVQRDPSGRVAGIVWSGGNSEKRISGNDFRLAVGPRLVRSLLFDVHLRQGALHFSGHGYGHGVGMSQWGARTMAERGMSYQEILAYYYPGTTVQALLAPQMARR